MGCLNSSDRFPKAQTVDHTRTRSEAYLPAAFYSPAWLRSCKTQGQASHLDFHSLSTSILSHSQASEPFSKGHPCEPAYWSPAAQARGEPQTRPPLLHTLTPRGPLGRSPELYHPPCTGVWADKDRILHILALLVSVQEVQNDIPQLIGEN